MASDTLTRWGTALVTTALAAAVVVGCAPDREGPEVPVVPEQVPVSTAPDAGQRTTAATTAPGKRAPEQPAEDGEPETETADGTVPGMGTESGQDAAAPDRDSDGSEAAPDGTGTSADAGSDDSQDATSTGAGY